MAMAGIFNAVFPCTLLGTVGTSAISHISITSCPACWSWISPEGRHDFPGQLCSCSRGSDHGCLPHAPRSPTLTKTAHQHGPPARTGLSAEVTTALLLLPGQMLKVSNSTTAGVSPQNQCI